MCIRDSSWDQRISASIDLVEHLCDDFERQVMLALQGQDKAQALDVGLRELPVAGLGALGGDESLLFKEAKFRGGQVTKLTLQPFKHLANTKKHRLMLSRCGLCRHLLLPRKVEARSKERELELADLHLDAVVQIELRVDAFTRTVGAVQRAEIANREACARSQKLSVTA